jgi:hypothetical protein
MTANVRVGGKYRWDVEILPDAESPKTCTRLGQPGEAYAQLPPSPVAATL